MTFVHHFESMIEGYLTNEPGRHSDADENYGEDYTQLLPLQKYVQTIGGEFVWVTKAVI